MNDMPRDALTGRPIVVPYASPEAYSRVLAAVLPGWDRKEVPESGLIPFSAAETLTEGSGHDAFCEAEFIPGPMMWTACECGRPEERE
jgi:hypothetical protein